MKELKCPKCGSAFSVDEADYSFILQQVKTAEFNAEVGRRLGELLKNEETKNEMALVKVRSEAADALKEKEFEIATLNTAVEKKDEELSLAVLEKEKKGLEVVAKKDAEIARLKASVEKNAEEVKLALLEKEKEDLQVVAEKDAQIAKLKEELAKKD